MHFKLKRSFVTFMAITLMGVNVVNISHADETVKEKVKEMGNDTKRATKKTVRKVQDETCEMVNGKMKCIGKKIKHSAENAGDKVEDAID